MVKYILLSCCILLGSSTLKGWYTPEIWYVKSGKVLEENQYAHAGLMMSLLCRSTSDSPPQDQIRYAARILEWSIPTYHWEVSLKVLHQTHSLIGQVDLKDDSIRQQTGVLLYRIGELASNYGMSSRNTGLRRQAVKILDRAMHFLPVDDPHYVYALVQSSMMKRILKDIDGAREDLILATRLAGNTDSKAKMRAHQGWAIFHHKQADDNYSTWIDAKQEIGSAREIAQRIPDEDPTDALIQAYYYGLFHTYRYKDPFSRSIPNKGPEAEEIFLEADSIFQLHPYPDYHLNLCYSKLAGIYYREGKYKDAVEYDLKSYETMDSLGYPPNRRASQLGNVGSGYMKIGENQKNQVFQLNGLSILEQTSQKESNAVHYTLGNLYNNLATSMSDSTTETQVQHFEIALDYLQKVSPPNYNSVRASATIQKNLGEIYARVGSEVALARSKQYFSDAITSWSLLSLSHPEIASTHAQLAKMLYPHDPEAELHLKEAIQFPLPGNTGAIKTAEINIGIGSAYFERGEHSRALEYFRKSLWLLALDTLGSREGIPKADDISERNLGLLALQGIGNSLKSMGEEQDSPELLQESLDAYQMAIDLFQVLRRQQTAQTSQVKLASRAREQYGAAISIALELSEEYPESDYLSQAFKLAEQSRGLVLLAAISSPGAAASAGVPDSILLQQRLLDINYDRLRRERSQATNSEKTAEINADLLAIDAKQERLNRFLKENYPEYFSQMYETETTSFEEVQATLKGSDQAVVEYFYGDSTLITFALTEDTFIVQQEPITKDFSDKLSFIQATQVKPILEDWGDQYWQTAHDLYQFLLGDLTPELPARLLIIPDGRLNYLSFDALTSQPFDSAYTNASYHELPYLVYDKVISYDYSYTIRTTRKPYEVEGPATLLAMAPSFNSPHLPELPKSMENVKELGRQYNGTTILTGEDATLASFREKAPQNAIVDLATHGKMDPINSSDCKLYFCPGPEDNGKLHLGEIYNLKLNARMAVLEACESGLGPNASGEGVMSLARGFTFAGCNTIVTSLWNVAEEDITGEIFDEFYHHLSEGMPVDSALTFAKRDYLLANRTSPGHLSHYYNPFFWSEMIVIGDTSPIKLDKRKSYQANIGAFAGIALILLTIIILGRRWQRRRKNISTNI